MSILNGKLYKGSSMEGPNVIATIRDGLVYSGGSLYTGHILFRISDFVTIEEFVAIWFAVNSLTNSKFLNQCKDTADSDNEY